MILTLHRDASTDESTSGVLTTEDGITFYTIEQPWRGNLRGHSCVPKGTYELVPYVSPKHGSTFQLHNPELNIYGRGSPPPGGRSLCELHSANWAEQLEGCIALGLEDQPMYDPLTGHVEPAVEESASAVTRLFELMGPMTQGHSLVITGD